MIKENTSSEGSGKKIGNETRADSFMALISQALKLVEDDYLGGQGTRGYGRVKFKIKSVKEKTAQDYLKGKEPKDSGTYKEHFKTFMNGTN